MDQNKDINFTYYTFDLDLFEGGSKNTTSKPREISSLRGLGGSRMSRTYRTGS